MIRDKKGKPAKAAKKHPDANMPKSKSDERLLSELQKESLKVHGDPLEAPKKAPAKKQ